MNLSKTVLSILAGILFTGQVFADLLPPPDSMRKYTLALCPELSQVMFSYTKFQTSKEVQLPKVGPWDACTAVEKTWTTPSDAPVQAQKAISCKSRGACYPRSAPECTMSFVAPKDLPPAYFINILSAETLKAEAISN